MVIPCIFFAIIIILYILETSNFHYFKIIVKNIFPWLQIVPTQIGRQFSLMNGYVCVSSCWFFWCFIHISRLKNIFKCKAFLKSVLCCYLWEMIMLFNKVSHTHIFIKRGVDKPVIHSNTVLFPSILVRPHCTEKKERKLPPVYFLTENNLIGWALMSDDKGFFFFLWTQLTFSLCPVALVTSKKAICIEFPSIVYSM